MSDVLTNLRADDAERRRRLHDGQILVYSATPQSYALAAHARSLINAAFGGHDPEQAHLTVQAPDLDRVLSDLSITLAHHEVSRSLIRELLLGFDCSLDETFFDRLRMCASVPGATEPTPVDPYRDTWHAAPFSQINWRIPLLSVGPESAPVLHTRYWNKPVRNGSRHFDHHGLAGRTGSCGRRHTSTGARVGLEQSVEPGSAVHVIPDRAGLILYSGNHLQSSAPNSSSRTRFGLRFSTVNIDDIAGPAGPANVDSDCAITSIRDFRRAADFGPISEETALRYERHQLTSAMR